MDRSDIELGNVNVLEQIWAEDSNSPLIQAIPEMNWFEFNEQVHVFLEMESKNQKKIVRKLSEGFASALESWCEAFGTDYLEASLEYSVSKLEGDVLEVDHLPVALQKHLAIQLGILNFSKKSQKQGLNGSRSGCILH